MSSPSPTERPSAPLSPLIVPLESLVRTDVALEAAFAEVRRSPVSLVHLLVWRVRGRLYFGKRVAATGGFDAGALPYDDALIARLKDAKAEGRKVVLMARVERSLADAVAARLGFFDAVFAPEADAPNGAVEDRVRAEYPGAEFVYGTPVPASSRARALLKSLRPHQWTKNALIFLPALLAHAAAREGTLVQALWGFAAFCLCASSVYILNDLLDLHADRAHHHKRSRPFASGALPLVVGLLFAPLLLAGAAGIALSVSREFAGVLGTYYAATLAYSFALKRVALLDVIVLAGLYTVRIIAGGVATGVPVSQWLLAFSMFIFLSLAFVKRYSEVDTMRKRGVAEAKGRGYRASDLEQLSSLGASAGFISVLVLALYVNSNDVTKLYAHPLRLLGMLPLFLYWISRVWLLAHRGQMHDDPIVFAIRDKVSYVIAALVALVVWSAI